MSTDASSSPPSRPRAAVVGGGPAGLMAAERLARAGAQVVVFDRMPSLARKFLLAGRGGLNLTHSEPFDAFLRRYGPEAERLAPANTNTLCPRYTAAQRTGPWPLSMGDPERATSV